jgi:hypothetical protein
MAGLDPAIPIIGHRRAKLIGIAGSSPAMTRQVEFNIRQSRRRASSGSMIGMPSRIG